MRATDALLRGGLRENSDVNLAFAGGQRISFEAAQHQRLRGIDAHKEC